MGRTADQDPRNNLPILREEDLDILDDDNHRSNGQKAETGVEKSEESAALRSEQAAAAGDKVKKTDIPVRPAVPSDLQYERYYSPVYQQPATYIRFSSTVEDCTGCPYDMDEEDDAFLQSLNKNRENASRRCSPDQFEMVMNALEETAQQKQPYAAVDSPPVLAFAELEPGLDEYLEDDHARAFSNGIYEHWKARRLKANNKSLTKSLKFETGADTDDADPYVCFRRRELRQTRKTRGRDAHSAEKLKKLRKELEEARELLALIRQREITKREQLAVERELFEQRTNLRQVKGNLPDQYRQGDDDLLVNQKKKKPLEITQRQPGQPLRIPQRADGRPEQDLVSLSVILKNHEKEIQDQIELRIAQHRKWNEGYVDMTTAPLTPPLEVGVRSTFRTATTEYLPTPPASISSEQFGDVTVDLANLNSDSKRETVAVRYASPSCDGATHSQPSFRRRIGRGGRLFIDRRGLRIPAKDMREEHVAERYRYDEDDDEEEVPTYYYDPFDSESMRFRSNLFKASQQPAKRPPDGSIPNLQRSTIAVSAA
ncbi:MAG: hypothetical protein Q9163_001992 [Psora crenata]